LRNACSSTLPSFMGVISAGNEPRNVTVFAPVMTWKPWPN
jgi:hypothetical protein